MKKSLLTILCVLLSTISWAQGTTAGDESYNEAYGVLVIDENNTASLTMYYDANRDAHREGQVIGLDEMMQNQAWMMYRENVTTVVFDSSFAECRPTSTAFWFAYCRSLTSIVGLQYLRTDETTNMSFMFNECSSLTSLDLSSLNTENVTNISGMLGGCRSLTSVDLSGFNTRQVTNMNSLFEQSAALTTINLSSFNTSQVTDMSYMFNECSALTTIYVGSDWSTEAVTNGTDMFNKCTNLVGGAGTTFSADHIDHTYARIDAEGTPGYLTDSKNASMTHFVMITVEGNGEVSAGQAAVIRDRGDVHVANGEPLEMFFFPDEGYQLASVKIDTQDVTSQVTPATEYSAASYTIPGIYGDLAITVTFAQTSTDAEAYAALSEDSLTVTFYYDNQKTARGGVDINNSAFSEIADRPQYGKATTAVFDASFANFSPTSTAHWFEHCFSLTSISNIEYLNTANVTDMSSMFDYCEQLTSLDVSHFNTENVTNMSSMFSVCARLTSLDVSGFNTANVTDMNHMFSGCRRLTSLDVSGFNTTNVTAMNYMFYFCAGLTSLDVSRFNTENVTNMSSMFQGCSGLTSIDLNNFITTNVTDMDGMFMESFGLTSLDLSNFNTANVTTIGYMFRDCSGLTSIDLSSFNTARVSYMHNMFNGCSNLTTIFAGNEWSTNAVLSGSNMFTGCTNLVGGAGTAFDASHTNETYARIDGGPNSSTPGYFTDKNAAPVDNDLEIYVVQADTTMSPNVPITATPNVIMTPGNDSIWQVKYSIVALTEEYRTSGKAYLEFNADTYYPGLSTTAIFRDCIRGEYNPKDGETLGEGTSYSTHLRNLPKNGTYMIFETRQDGSLIIPMRIHSKKPLYVVDSEGKAKSDIQFKDGLGQTLQMMTSPLCAVLDTVVAGYVSFNVKAGEKYYVFNRGSNCGYGGYVFSTRSIEIDPATTANVLDSLNYVIPNAEPYAVLSDNNTVLTFYYDENKTSRGGMSVGPFAYETERGWNSNAADITSLVFDESFAEYHPTSTAMWFQSCSNLKSITNIQYLKTDSVTTMGGMFSGCSSLTNIDLSNFNTDKVTSMFAMFSGCSSLMSLDLSKFNTTNVTETGAMFSSCSSLTSLDLSNFNTSNMTNVSSMFAYSTSLKTLDLSGFRFNSATFLNIRFMFRECIALQTIYVDENWTLPSSINGSSMFEGCTSLVGGAGTIYSADHTDYTYAHIDGGTANPGYFTDKNATPMEKVATPTFSWRNDELTMSCTTEGATIMYLMSDEDTDGDGVITDSDYKQYSAPIEVKRDVIIKAIGIKEGMTTSDTITLDYPYEAWYKLYETCMIGQEILYRASRSPRVPEQLVAETEARIAYCYDFYNQRTAEKQEIEDMTDRLRAELAEIEKMMQVPASYSNYVLTASEDATMAEIADQYSYYGNQVAAIVWNSSVPMTESDLQQFTSNPNLLIYAQSESLVPANRNNVVINGVAKNVVLTTTATGNCNFYAPQAFTAEAIQYTRTFSQQTQIGVSRGWEAIALPFTVQTYTHADRGVIAPFGNSASENHFWLRELTENGLQNALTIEANKPYIISMPNSEEYRPETNLAGQVTFSALNAIVPVTEATPVEYGSISLVPAFQSRSAQTEIYALNVGEERNGYPEGSVFERDYRTVRPFEAYTLHRDNQNPAPQFIMIGGDMGNGTTGIEELVDKRMNTNDSWYTIDGRRLQGAPAGKGLYIRNGKKVIVR